MNLNDVLFASKILAKNTGNADLSDYYTKSQTDDLISGKVDKEDGKGLSTNDFTNDEKSKLAGIENYDDTEIKTTIANVAEQTALNSSTLGYQRKNMLKLTIPPSNKNGVSFSIADGVVTLTGTATANADCYFPEYIYSLTEADTWLYIAKKSTLSCYGTLGTLMVAYYAPNVEYTATNRLFKTITVSSPFTFEEGSIIIGLYIKITANTDYTDKTLYSMLRYAEITDSTYEPYKPSVQEQIDNKIKVLDSMAEFDALVNKTADFYFIKEENS